MAKEFDKAVGTFPEPVRISKSGEHGGWVVSARDLEKAVKVLFGDRLTFTDHVVLSGRKAGTTSIRWVMWVQGDPRSATWKRFRTAEVSSKSLDSLQMLWQYMAAHSTVTGAVVNIPNSTRLQYLEPDAVADMDPEDLDRIEKIYTPLGSEPLVVKDPMTLPRDAWLADVDASVEGGLR